MGFREAPLRVDGVRVVMENSPLCSMFHMLCCVEPQTLYPEPFVGHILRVFAHHQEGVGNSKPEKQARFILYLE